MWQCRFDFLSGPCRDGGAKPLPENETTAASSTCIRVPFRVSMDLVPPPSTSRFYLEWPGGPKEDIGITCDLMAAHRDCVLFRLTSIVRTKTPRPDLIFPDDYYIYRPDVAQLIRLPTCIRPADETDGKVPKPEPEKRSDPDDESELGDFVVTKQMEWAEMIIRKRDEERLAMGVDTDEEVVRSSLIGCLGLVCRTRSDDQGAGDDDEFVVAEMRLNKDDRRKVLAELSLLRSGSSEWVHMSLPVHCYKKRDSNALFSFGPQAVTPFGDDLCWVSYDCGIILCRDILDHEAIPKLSFVPFPLPLKRPSRLDGHELRGVSATDGGCLLKFIDVVVDEQLPRRTSFTIVAYNLISKEEDGQQMMKWEEVASMTSEELWGLEAPGRIPHEVPMFPLVSMDKPQIVHFQLIECTDYIDTVTLISVDMSARTVVSVLTHIKGEQELHGEDADVAGARTGLPHSFLPATFSKRGL